MVPRLTGVITSTNINRWDIRIQSTTLEYISNGMTTRLYFNVISTGEEKGVPSGIDFSVWKGCPKRDRFFGIAVLTLTHLTVLFMCQATISVNGSVTDSMFRQ